MQEVKNCNNMHLQNNSRNVNDWHLYKQLRRRSVGRELNLCSGWLKTWGRGRLSRFLKKNRWCVLRAVPNQQLLLDVYTNQYQVVRTQTVNLSGPCLDEDAINWKEGTTSFLVTNRGRKLEFFARDEISAQDWYEAIETWVRDRTDLFLPQPFSI